MTSSQRWGVRAVGVVLVLGGLWVGAHQVVRGDTYCGQLLWDTTYLAGCEVMGDLWLLMAALVLGGAALLVGTAPKRLIALALCGAFGLALLGANRLLEPQDDQSYCGSVLNRHLTGPTREEHDERCDELLRPHKQQATAAFGGSALLVIGAAVVGTTRGRRGG